MDRMRSAHVLVVGLGGVGGYVAELLARAGIGHLTVIDADNVSLTNINRQIIALHSNVGESKAKLYAQRLKEINPDIQVECLQEFIRDERTEAILKSSSFDFVADAIDSLSPKVYLIATAYRLEIPIVSSMGAGAKSDPEKIHISDISKSHNCSLARAVRKKLNKMGIRKGITVVYSSEFAQKESVIAIEGEPNKLTTAGTVSYMPALFGCRMVAHIIDHL